MIKIPTIDITKDKLYDKRVGNVRIRVGRYYGEYALAIDTLSTAHGAVALIKEKDYTKLKDYISKAITICKVANRKLKK